MSRWVPAVVVSLVGVLGAYAGTAMGVGPLADAAESLELSLTGPERVEPGAEIKVTSVVIADGVPAPGVPILLTSECRYPLQNGDRRVLLTTDENGTFTQTSTAGACSLYWYRAEVASNQWPYDRKEIEVWVNRTHPTLTLEAPSEAIGGDTVDLAATLTTDGGPVAGEDITIGVDRPDGTEQRATVTTGDDGVAVWHDVVTQSGRNQYRATYDGSVELEHTANITSQAIYVTQLVPELTLSGPDTAALDETFTLTGTLSGPDLPADVQLREPGGQTRSLTTGPDGSFAATVTATLGGTPGWSVRYPGSVRYQATAASHTVTVPKLPTSFVDLEPATALVVGEFSITGRLTGVDGPAQVKLTPITGSGSIQYATTAADGTFRVLADANQPGAKEWRLDYAGDGRHAAATAVHTVDMQQIPTTLTIDGPVTADLLDIVRPTGRLTGTSYPGEVHIVSPWNELTISVDPGETFYLPQKQLTKAGSATWTVTYRGDAGYAPASATYTVSVPYTPTISLSADRQTYPVGQTASILVNISNTDNRAVTVTATRSNGFSRVLYNGTVAQDGLTLSRRMTYTEKIVVSTAADATHNAAQSELTLNVRPDLTTTPLSPVTYSGDVAIYRNSAHPVFAARTTPVLPGVCMRFRLQQYSSGSWQTVKDSNCRTTDSTGEARWRYRDDHSAGVAYRVRASFGGDSLNLDATAPWARFRFRR